MIHFFLKNTFVIVSPVLAIVYWWNNLKNPDDQAVVNEHNSSWINDI